MSLNTHQMGATLLAKDENYKQKNKSPVTILYGWFSADSTHYKAEEGKAQMCKYIYPAVPAYVHARF